MGSFKSRLARAEKRLDGYAPQGAPAGNRERLTALVEQYVDRMGGEVREPAPGEITALIAALKARAQQLIEGKRNAAS